MFALLCYSDVIRRSVYIIDEHGISYLHCMHFAKFDFTCV